MPKYQTASFTKDISKSKSSTTAGGHEFPLPQDCNHTNQHDWSLEWTRCSRTLKLTNKFQATKPPWHNINIILFHDTHNVNIYRYTYCLRHPRPFQLDGWRFKWSQSFKEGSSTISPRVDRFGAGGYARFFDQHPTVLRWAVAKAENVTPPRKHIVEAMGLISGWLANSA